MYPKLSDFLNDLLGTHLNLPIMSYGFFVALAFIIASWLVYIELKRKEQEGWINATYKQVEVGKPASFFELLFHFLISFFLIFKLVGAIEHYSLFANDPQKFLFSASGSWLWGVLIAIGYTAYIWYQKEKRKLKVPEIKKIEVHPFELTGSFLFIAAVFGILGAKIFNQFENWHEFITHPVNSLFSFSGLTFYGGLIVAAVAVIWYGAINKIHWKHLADAFAPALILGYGIGRMGCHVSGDGDWGIVNHFQKPQFLSFLPDWLWSYRYPHNIINAGVPIPGCMGEHCSVLPHGVFPTPIYETIMAIIIFLVLWSLRKKIKIPGVLFFIYLIFNGLERFLIEQIRVNSTYDIFNYKITQAELISPLLVLVGIVGWGLLVRNQTRKK